MLTSKHLSGKLIAGALLGMVCTGAMALDQFERDIQLAKKLNELGLTDYADVHINNLLKANPNADLLKAQLIDNLVAQNKMEEAREMLSRLQEGSEAYYNAMANIGVSIAGKRDFNGCVEYIEPALDFAIKTQKVKNFKTAFAFLMAAYKELGRPEDAQKVLQAIQAAEAEEKKSKKGDSKESKMQQRRQELFMRASFAIDGVEALQKKIAERGPALDQKFNDAVAAIKKANSNDLKKQLDDAAMGIRGKAAGFDEPKKKHFEQLEAKRAPLDAKFFDLVKKAINAKQEELAAINKEFRAVSKERADLYKELGALFDMSDIEALDYAKLVEDNEMLTFRQQKLDELIRARDAANQAYCKALTANKDYDAPGKERLQCYLRLGRLIGMTDAESTDFAHIAAVRWRQPGRMPLVLKGYQYMNDDERKKMEQKLPLDWLDVLYQCIADCEEVQWGGLDVLTAKAVVLNMRANALLNQQKSYEHALTLLRKYRDLFSLCDQAYSKDKEFTIDQSPGTDARIWEGMIYASYGDFLLKANKKPDAVKSYKKAFVTLGKVLKIAPKHKDAVAAYSKFAQVAKKIGELDPNIAADIKREVRKVPKPEGQVTEGDTEKLVTPLAESNFKQGMQMATELQKREHSKRPPTAAEWQKCIDCFKVVAKELDGKMAGKRNSANMPELLNRMIIAYGYTGDLFMVKTLGNYGLYKFKGDPLVSHGVLVAANNWWANADKLEKDTKNPKNVALGRQMKDQAIELYDLFLAIDKAHKNAPQVVVRIARDEFIRANTAGQKLNSEKLPDARAALRKAWIEGFDRAVARYDFVLNNYRNRPDLVDEAFERSAEAYTMTERYDKAIEVNKRFCDNGSEKPQKIITAKMDIASALYSMGGRWQKEARAKREEAAEISTEPPVKPEMAAVTAAPAANASAAAQAPAAPAMTQEQAQADFDKKMKEYEKALKDLEIDKEKKAELNAEADKLDEQAKAAYLEAIAHIDEFLNNWVAAGGKFASLANDPVTAKNRMRAASLLPWLYDGRDDKANAIKNFEAFAKTYPKDKSVPAYLLRLSVLYTELDKVEEASKILDRLSTEFKDTPEGKNAKFALARNLYSRANYKLALQNLKDIFDKPDLKKNLSVSNYRWIASELANCTDPKFRKVSAQYAILASAELLKMIRDVSESQVSDWVGDLKASEFKGNPEARKKFFLTLNEKLLIDAAAAANVVEDYKLAINYFTQLEKLNKKTPFYYQLCFGRANAYLKMNPPNYEAAKKDLIAVGRRANLSGQTLLYNKAQVMIGDIWEKQGDQKKAYAFYTMVAGLPYNDSTPLAIDPNNPEDDTPLYLERAVYKAADKAHELAADPSFSPETKKEMEDNMKAMIAKYKKYYPNGKYKINIRKLETEAN